LNDDLQRQQREKGDDAFPWDAAKLTGDGVDHASVRGDSGRLGIDRRRATIRFGGNIRSYSAASGRRPGPD
jgi:hypothetical protein